MRVRYQFAVRSEINLVADGFPKLSLERDGNRIQVSKPVTRSKFYISQDIVGNQPTVPNVDLRADWAVFIGVSLVDIELEPRGQISQDQVMNRLHPPAAQVLRDLVSWIRVLTRQYWVGYRERNIVEQQGWAILIDGENERSLGSVGGGFGFSYGRPLDRDTWLTIGAKLALRELPRPSQIFFCDALFDISQGDIVQAVAALGIAREMEANSLLSHILERRTQELQTIFEKHVRYKFTEATNKIIRIFGGEPFPEAEPGAARLLNTLYDMRGKAVHRGECTYDEHGKTVAVTFGDIPKFVEAAEKLFTWSENQRAKNL